jgi:uncharacterized protein (DUF2461 family)
MDTRILQPLIQRFLAALDSETSVQEHHQEHERRSDSAQQLLQLERIHSLAREELEAFLEDTDAWYGTRGRVRFRRELFGEDDERLPAVRETLADLIRQAETGLTAEEINTFLGALPWIGPAFLSEILALRFPDHYWLWNSPVQSFLEAQGVDVKAELPWGKKGDRGEQYMVAGRHIADVRRALSEAAGESVNFLYADLFIFWANQQEGLGPTPDPWAERIGRWLDENMPTERFQARQEGEERARALLESKLGQFDESDLRRFMADVSADWWNEKARNDRFMPGLYGYQINQMTETLDAFNHWVSQIWRADDDTLDALLDEFWKVGEVKGAGVSLPTVLLYLRDPQQYNIWLPVMSKGLKAATDFEPGRWRTAGAYRDYNETLNEFREKHQLLPQSVDVVLWHAARFAEPEGDGFEGFTEDTFAFLQELAANNSAEWMHKDSDENELRYRRVLREPLRALFQAVAPAIEEIDSALETEAKYGKVLAGIKKRWPDEEGPYHTYLWGAFYRKQRTKQTDAQLFVNVQPDHVRVGFSVAGARGSEVLTRFRDNLEQAPEMFLHHLQGLPDGIHVSIAEEHGLPEKRVMSIQTVDDLRHLYEVDLIDIERRYDAGDPLVLTPEFADEVSDLFEMLYPLFRFAITHDPAALGPVQVDPTTGDEEPAVVYTWEQLVDDTFLDQDFLEDVQLLMHDKKQIIFYGPPGTGKTWVGQRFAQYWVDQAEDLGGEVQIIQFHPSYAYEEFVEGIRPQSIKTQEGRQELSYPVKKGLFWRFCDLARTHPRRRYVLIIDEVNRGELPRILGELLYLLEYRRESVVLPYSGEPFGIPANMYLIGTMNTADRSIALVDHALRRRFHFIQMRPSPNTLSAYFQSIGDPAMAWTAELLDLLNRQLDRDGIEWHLHIGHSHFMRKDLDEAHIRLVWKHSVMPTLEEYFYRQPERLQSYQLGTLRAALGTA